MKPDFAVLAVILLVLAATALLVVVLQDEPPSRPVVEALAGPQPEHARR